MRRNADIQVSNYLLLAKTNKHYNVIITTTFKIMCMDVCTFNYKNKEQSPSIVIKLQTDNWSESEHSLHVYIS